MTIRHIITTPADLAAIYRERSSVCQQAADTASAKHSRELWQTQANVWSDAANIAAVTLFKPEAS
jgi:hypothetical protein